MLQVTINGQPHQFADGLTINQALRQITVEVPTLCHDDRIQPYGSCRLCTVEVKGMTSVSTLLSNVGLSNSPRSVGYGGRAITSGRLPSMERSNDVSSPQT
ncbi:MAG: hypothetical protein EBU23_16770 [Mycobacteriaceae bacterium]|nr:hypothetical protein [Mycobacteriaceae bacterium]